MEKHLNQICNEAGYTFVRTAIKEQADKSGTGVTALASALGQTALTYAKKYMAGEVDLRTENLCLLCNRFGWSPLSFFALDGHRFTTPLRHLHIMESAGISLEELLKEKGIEITDEPKRTEPAQEKRRVSNTAPTNAQTEKQEAQQAATENHWQIIAQSQQQVIESQKELIAMLRTELAKNNTGRPYFTSVADDTKV